MINYLLHGAIDVIISPTLIPLKPCLIRIWGGCNVINDKNPKPSGVMI